ncbi:unnamed protein product [Paramecium octaurelia]|uniref:Uncharacterized protein n=1 Tax=Paramecium octaurelia TaxID=43137 RepID=A0A8S1US13_PAROT|nr:unnamed protein product [Paramecium octaurelia]
MNFKILNRSLLILLQIHNLTKKMSWDRKINYYA